VLRCIVNVNAALDFSLRTHGVRTATVQIWDFSLRPFVIISCPATTTGDGRVGI